MLLPFVILSAAQRSRRISTGSARSEAEIHRRGTHPWLPLRGERPPGGGFLVQTRKSPKKLLMGGPCALPWRSKPRASPLRTPLFWRSVRGVSQRSYFRYGMRKLPATHWCGSTHGSLLVPKGSCPEGTEGIRAVGALSGIDGAAPSFVTASPCHYFKGEPAPGRFCHSDSLRYPPGGRLWRCADRYPSDRTIRDPSLRSG